MINALLLAVGTVVETTAALILLVPTLTAMLPSLGISLIQLGAIVVTNLAIGMLTPPMGICLIVSGSISGDRITAVSRKVLPFLAVLIIDLMIVTFYPPLTLWLAKLVAH
jgi:C4-dicarboxylate transporter DctM subunit